VQSTHLAKFDNIIKYYIREGWPIPIDVYSELDKAGYIIPEYINRMEQEVNGEGDFYDSHWGS
jgi:hypothetical protein